VFGNQMVHPNSAPKAASFSTLVRLQSPNLLDTRNWHPLHNELAFNRLVPFLGYCEVIEWAAGLTKTGPH
jgi:hypothetical protein